MTAVEPLDNVRPFPPDVLLGLTAGSELHVHRARTSMAALASSWPELADRYAAQIAWDALRFIAGGGAVDPVRLARDVRGICRAAGGRWAA